MHDIGCMMADDVGCWQDDSESDISAILRTISLVEGNRIYNPVYYVEKHKSYGKNFP